VLLSIVLSWADVLRTFADAVCFSMMFVAVGRFALGVSCRCSFSSIVLLTPVDCFADYC